MSTNQIEWELMLGEPWSPWSYSLYVMSLQREERGAVEPRDKGTQEQRLPQVCPISPVL